jgi:hypothetical protein
MLVISRIFAHFELLTQKELSQSNGDSSAIAAEEEEEGGEDVREGEEVDEPEDYAINEPVVKLEQEEAEEVGYA